MALGGNFTDGSGSIAVGGTAQDALGANGGRNYLLLQNLAAENLFVNFGVTAVLDQPSIRLQPGDVLEFGAQSSGMVPTGRISVIAATTGSKFVLKTA